MRNAFSLVELLIAMAILGVVAAVAVPRFIELRAEARGVMADQIQKQLNHTLATWRGTGGFLGSSANATGVLTVLTSSNVGEHFNNATPSSVDDVYDSSGLAVTSSAIRIAQQMSDFTLDTTDNTNNTYIFLRQTQDFIVRYDPAQMQFVVWPVEDEYDDEDAAIEESEETPAVTQPSSGYNRRNRPWRRFNHRHTIRWWWRR